VRPAPRRPLPSRLYAIVDADVSARAGWSVPDLAEAYLQAGVRCLQVRAKDAAARDVLAWTDRIAAADAARDAWIIVDDRVDVALAAGTRHVHLGQDDLPVADARAILGPDAVIGLSTHTLAQVRDACAADVGYVAVGPVFGTQTKATGYDPVGTDLVRLARACADEPEPASRGRLPIVGIGGITLDTAPRLVEAGADAVVVISDLLRGDDPRARVRAFLHVLGES
jgi:thiamine-phosphate pyrophosphorylase